MGGILQQILLYFGVFSIVREDPETDSEGRHYESLLVWRSQVGELMDSVGFVGQLMSESMARTLVETGVYSMKKMAPGEPDPFVLTVRSVEPLSDEVEVCDIVTETHSFLANGILVHNCGEQPLGPHENCMLGHVVLPNHFRDGKLDIEDLRATVSAGVRLLNAVLDGNRYVPHVPQLENAAKAGRRIGLGITGLADLLVMEDLSYGSPDGARYAGGVMANIRYFAMSESARMAEESGESFPLYEKSAWAQKPLVENNQFFRKVVNASSSDGQRPSVEQWTELAERIEKHGIRNSCFLTVAPTGTTSLLAGVEGYGCEPIFAHSYVRNVEGKGKGKLVMIGKLLSRRLEEMGADEQTKEHVRRTGRLPEKYRGTHLGDVFAIANDISMDGHIRMQSELQYWVDSSISKTINCPKETTVDQVVSSILDAYDRGLKGFTVYRNGCREQQVLNAGSAVAPAPVVPPSPSVSSRQEYRARPARLAGETMAVETKLGKIFISLNSDREGPREVFVTGSKPGTDVMAAVTAFGLLISRLLAIPSPMAPADRLRMVIDDFSGMMGGFKTRQPGGNPESPPNYVCSIPEAIAFGLKTIMDIPLGAATTTTPRKKEREDDNEEEDAGGIYDMCAQCHQLTFVKHEKCGHCTNPQCGATNCA